MTKRATDKTEIWLAIPGYEGLYEVSNFSRVRSLDRRVAHPESDFMTLAGKLMAIRFSSTGFLVVRLSKDGIAKDTYIERVVASLFPRNEEADLSLDNEIWRDVVGYEGYYRVSNLGRVRGVGRYVSQRQGGTQLRRGKIIHGVINRGGYRHLVLCKDGKQKTLEVQRLVAKAFIENPNNLPCINHKDSNKTNNRPENLEWCTQRENVRHAVKERDRRRIPAEIEAQIRIRHANGENAASISRNLGISYKTALRLTDGNKWRHSDPD